MSLPRSNPSPRWWMTGEAWSALHAELERLEAEIAADRLIEPDEDVLWLPVADAVARLRALRDIHDEAGLDDTPGRVAIGRTVTIRETDGELETYLLVLPGDGDPGRGRVSADSPLGSAVLGATADDVVTVVAPAGSREVRVVAVD